MEVNRKVEENLELWKKYKEVCAKEEEGVMDEKIMNKRMEKIILQKQKILITLMWKVFNCASRQTGADPLTCWWFSVILTK